MFVPQCETSAGWSGNNIDEHIVKDSDEVLPQLGGLSPHEARGSKARKRTGNNETGLVSETLSGFIARVAYHSPQNGFAVLKAELRKFWRKQGEVLMI